MHRLAKLQFLGPATVLLTVGAAELAAFALAQMPTSATLWYVNLKIFQVFQESSFTLPAPFDVPFSQFFLIALPLFALASCGLTAKRSFMLALSSHLSFIYAGFIVCCYVNSQPHPLTASISNIAFSSGPNIYLLIFLAGASLISILISHYQYLLVFGSQAKLQIGASHP